MTYNDGARLTVVCSCDSRHDYENISTAAANGVMAHLRASLASLPGRTIEGLVVEHADDFTFTDSVDGSVASKQGIRVQFEHGSRVVFRLSGTGTEGATLRVYLERFEADPAQHSVPLQAALEQQIRAADALAEISARIGRAPDVIS